MEFKKFKQRGQVLVFYALMIPLLLLFAGAGLDLGWYYLNVSRLQNAADAAALAGAQALIKTDDDFKNYYVAHLVSNYVPENYGNYEEVYKNTFENENTGKLSNYRTAEEVKDNLKAGRDSAEEYVRKNLSDSETVFDSSDGNDVSATDGWSRKVDSAVKGTAELKYYLTDGKNDNFGSLYYVVNLHEKIRHLILPGWFGDMDAPVRAVVLLQPRYTGLISPMKIYEEKKVIDNWEEQNKYKTERGGKWNHYKAKDGVGVKYANNDPYRTESVVVKPSSRNSDKSSKKSDGETSNAANGNQWYEENVVDSINIDFRADVGVKSMFTTDWDLGVSVASALSNFSKYTNVSNSSPWKIGDGEDKRVLFNVDFEESFDTRSPQERADVLWTRIESDPIIRQINASGGNVANYNSVRQVTVNFSSDNTTLNSAGNYEYRPYVLFYTGPENIDSTVDSNGVLIRHSQPVVINFNENTNAIIYMPESPVIINGNGKKFTGFVIAKCYLSSVTQEEMTSGNTITLYDGFNTPNSFKCDFIKGKDSSKQNVFFHEKDLVDRSYIDAEYTGEGIAVNELASGDIHVTEKAKAPEYILLEYTKADSENEAYEVKDADGKHDENKTFAAYVNATYKEKFKAFSGLTDSDIVAVTFPDENYNETTATYYVENSSKIISSTPENNNYVKVLINGNTMYLDKRKLPYVKVRSEKEYFYVNVYDLKLLGLNNEKMSDGKTSVGKGVRMIDNSYTDDQLTNSYKKTGDISTTAGDVHVNRNDAIYNQYGDSWAIDRTWYNNQRNNWKKNKLNWLKKNDVNYFQSQEEIATLPTEPQIIAKYHAITMLDENDEELLDDEGKPIVKYVKDDNNANIQYYTKVQNNDKNLDNYIIVDKKGNILTKPLTDPAIFSVTDEATNDALDKSGSYWKEEYTDAPKDPYKANDPGKIEDGQYRGNAEYNSDKDYLIPAFERVYKKSLFNLSEDSCYSYFGLEKLIRVNYTYMNVDEVNKKTGPNNKNTYDKWKVDDMFFTTRRAEWID